jgi:Zn finger protein HypA/HybF involved in hydrogenase expression
MRDIKTCITCDNLSFTPPVKGYTPMRIECGCGEGDFDFEGASIEYLRETFMQANGCDSYIEANLNFGKKLKPCPNCGSEDVYFTEKTQRSGEDTYIIAKVECGDCLYEHSTTDKGKKDLIRRVWNKCSISDTKVVEDPNKELQNKCPECGSKDLWIDANTQNDWIFGYSTECLRCQYSHTILGENKRGRLVALWNRI